MAKVSKQEFEKALVALEEAHDECLKQIIDSKAYKLFRDATIQRFEFCVELAWKVAIKSLGVPVTSPRPAMRELLRAGLIQNIDRWFDFIDARNKSPHSYDENIAAEVFSHIADFRLSARELLSKI
jgi:nucleotidyltransferase substrate binding protein (TIGR01987 family)